MKIAHIVLDEKFPDSAYEMFEAACPGCNTFFLPGKKVAIKYLKKIKPVRIGRHSFLYRNFVEWINSFDALIIHGMTAFSLELISRCRVDLKIVWIGMGFDYYDIICNKKTDLLKEKTKSAVLEKYPPTFSVGGAFVKILSATKKNILYPKSVDKKKSLSRVNYFCPVLESEYFAVKGKVGCWNAEYIDWNYGNSARTVDGEYGHHFMLGSNVLLGNSATPENNHIDALRFIKENEKFLEKGAKIITPLSYGDFRYREIVICYGKKLFGEKFVPLMEMVSPEEYSKIIRNCGLVFMNHLRQQAGNNIIQALFMGARVILDSRNPFYNEYKRKSVFLTSLDEAEKDPKLLSMPLTKEEASFNQCVLKKLRSSEVAIKKTKRLVETIGNSDN